MVITPKISVIMPVHNTPQNILEQCLESIEGQTFKEFELICVDDASNNESTKQVLQEYGGRYKNVVNIRLKEKSGAAIARNIGFDNAKGEYVIFLDSDDLFSESFLKKLYDRISESNANVCICGFSRFQVVDGKKEIISEHRLEEEYINFANERMLLYATTSPCNKLCKRDYLVKERIKFQTLSSDNDVYYALMAVLSTNEITVIPDGDLFFYRFNTNFQISSNIDPLNLLKAIKKIREDLSKKSIFKKWYDYLILIYLLHTGIMELKRCTDQNKCKIFYEKCQKYLIETDFKPNKIREREMLRCWRNKTYNTNWINLIGDYASQLNINRDALLYSLNYKSVIYVWGLGKRGNAFLSFAKSNDVIIEGVYDQRGSCCCANSDIKFSSPKEMLGASNLIIATNELIFEYVSRNNKNSATILNLEDYCPL